MTETAQPTKHRIRFPIAAKLSGMLVLCIALLLLINWAMNRFALNAYYQNEKKKTLVSVFNQVNEAKTVSDLTDSLSAQEKENNVTILLWTENGFLYSSRSDTVPDNTIGGPMIHVRPEDGLLSSLSSDDMEAGTYRIRTVMKGDGTLARSPSITLIGETESGVFVSLRTPLSDISESTSIFNYFLLLSGLITLVIGLVAVLLIARNFSRPVRKLSEAAGQIARLDFRRAEPPKGHDELSDLGESLNTMAQTLEQTISGLQSANAQLEKDVEWQARQNESRKMFIRNVSHELKTPIALIQTYAEGLHEDVASDGASRDFYCEVIEDESQKMSQLIKKMTLLMQLECGSEKISMECFDAAGLIAHLIGKDQPLFSGKSITVTSAIASPCYVWGDAFLMENVFTNFLTNALHHVSDDGIVTFTASAAADNRTRFEVFNTGYPIPEEDLPHLFESFYKVDKAHARAYGGSGIGLSVVAAIMNAHGMPYGVENRNDGVVFYIELDKA